MPAAAASTTNEVAQCPQAKTISLLGAGIEVVAPLADSIECELSRTYTAFVAENGLGTSRFEAAPLPCPSAPARLSFTASNMLSRSHLFFAIFALSSLWDVGGPLLAAETESADWRRSFAALVKALDKVPLTEMPATKTHIGHQLGARVDSEAAIMKRFGGRVEFEGVFDSLKTVEFAQKKHQKIEITMARPAELSGNTETFLHLYPKRGSLPAWREVKPNSALRFRGTVTGITWFQPVIYGVPHLHGLAIRVEDGEIVSQ